MSTISASTTSTTAYKVTADTTGTLVLQTGATPTTAVTIDTSQNVGLGVTPSAWNSAWKAVQVGAGANFVGRTGVVNQLQLIANGYFNGTNYIYQNTGEATQYFQTGGYHAWGVAASGTAGNAITFTQAMTLDASGNLGVGTTSPVARVHARTGASSALSDSRYMVRAEGTSEAYLSAAANDYVGVRFPNASSASQAYVDYYHGINSMLFGVNNAERMRIDSSGNLLVANTAQHSTEKFGVTQSANSMGAYIFATDSSTYTTNVMLLRGSRNTTNSTWSFLRCYNNAEKLFIYDSGNVVNANNSYGAISDIKLKENIVDATPKLADLMQVRVRSYNMKNDPEQKHLGVIAQELEEVFPAMIQEAPDQDIDGNDLGTVTKTVKYSVFVPMLIKAVQEQQAIIETLTNRITALESK